MGIIGSNIFRIAKANYNVPPYLLKAEQSQDYIAIVVVSENTSSIKMANFKKQFLKLDMEEAIVCAVELVKNKKADL